MWFLWWFGCGDGGLLGGPCEVEAEAVAIAGGAPTDCGFYTDDGTDAWACGIAAFQDEQPFVLYFDLTGVDSLIHRAVIYDGTQVWLLAQDTYGGSDRIDGWECDGPTVGPGESGWDELGCAFLNPQFNHYHVCGDDSGQVPVPIDFPKVY